MPTRGLTGLEFTPNGHRHPFDATVIGLFPGITELTNMAVRWILRGSGDSGSGYSVVQGIVKNGRAKLTGSGTYLKVTHSQRDAEAKEKRVV